MTYHSVLHRASASSRGRSYSRRSIIIAIIFALISAAAYAQGSAPRKKVLMVVTSNNRLNHGSPGGYFLPEAVDFYVVLKKYGYTLDDIDIVSPKGGVAPMYQRSQYLNYPPFRALPERSSLLSKLDATFTTEGLVTSDYNVIYYVGGFASLFDYPHDTSIARVARDIYEAGGVIGAVCHGPSGLLPIRLSDGTMLIEGKRLTARPIEEETGDGTITRDEVLYYLPFILEEKLTEHGAVVEKGPSLEPNVVVSDRIVTGQNPASTDPVAEAIIGLLNEAGADHPDGNAASSGISLAQNEPNPFSASTVIRYSLHQPSHVRLRIYDVSGRVVATPVDGAMEAGEHATRVERGGLADGIYLYRLEADGIVETKRMIVTR